MPLIGEALYRLNTLRSIIGLMYRRHVYSDASLITPAFVAKKQGVARRPAGSGGRGAQISGYSGRYVVGMTKADA
jgi:hypothetical protein